MMKTININLIGDLARSPEYNKAVLQKDDLDLRTKLYVVIFITTTSIIFIVCFGLWFAADTLSRKLESQLNKLKAEHQELIAEENKLITYNNDIKSKLKIASLKKLAREKINNSFIPWSLVLSELAAKIPKEITVLDISKITVTKNNVNTNTLKISGIIPAAAATKTPQHKPISLISYLLLNINEDKNALLTDAEVKKIEYKSEQNIYEFEITTNLRKSYMELLQQKLKSNKAAKAKPKQTVKTIRIPIKAVKPVMDAAMAPMATAKPDATPKKPAAAEPNQAQKAVKPPVKRTIHPVKTAKPVVKPQNTATKDLTQVQTEQTKTEIAAPVEIMAVVQAETELAVAQTEIKTDSERELNAKKRSQKAKKSKLNNEMTVETQSEQL
ncbi:MAG: hypothetical protein GX568_06055 [Candidatus Gastranaerophilales bacterium]|nr:hypothetical protein [Candidatus Gastranaerophilales bacterium]